MTVHGLWPCTQCTVHVPDSPVFSAVGQCAVHLVSCVVWILMVMQRPTSLFSQAKVGSTARLPGYGTAPRSESAETVTPLTRTAARRRRGARTRGLPRSVSQTTHVTRRRA